MAQFVITGTSGVPVKLTAQTTTCRKAVLLACSAIDGPTASPNAGIVGLGYSSVSGEQPLEMQPGDERVFEAPPNGRLDLSNIYLQVTNTGDGVVVTYF